MDGGAGDSSYYANRGFSGIPAASSGQTTPGADDSLAAYQYYQQYANPPQMATNTVPYDPVGTAQFYQYYQYYFQQQQGKQ